MLSTAAVAGAAAPVSVVDGDDDDGLVGLVELLEARPGAGVRAGVELEVEVDVGSWGRYFLRKAMRFSNCQRGLRA